MMVEMKKSGIRKTEQPQLIEDSQRCIKNPTELNYVVMFRLLAEFNRENMHGLFEKRGNGQVK